MKQKSSKPEKTSASALPLAMPLILPVVTLLLCAAIVLVCSLRPYEKLHTYLQIAFMDDLKQAPSSSSDGLEIVQNDITTNYSGKIAKTGEPVYPAFGEQYGVLSCEAIDLYVPVYWGQPRNCWNWGLVRQLPLPLPEQVAMLSSVHMSIRFSIGWMNCKPEIH